MTVTRGQWLVVANAQPRQSGLTDRGTLSSVHATYEAAYTMACRGDGGYSPGVLGVWQAGEPSTRIPRGAELVDGAEVRS